MAGSPHIALCVFCGTRPATTRDHTPPKGMFPKPRPADLITVPSCYECNSAAKLDDEYFKVAMVLREDVRGHAAIGRLLPKVMQGLQRPEAIGLRAYLRRRLRRIPLFTASGLFTRHAGGILIDNKRIARTIVRTVQGLHFHHYGERLLDDWVTPQGQPDIRDAEAVEAFVSVAGPLYRQMRFVANNAFGYARATADDMPGASVWLMLFYETVFFTAVVGPPELFDAAE